MELYNTSQYLRHLIHLFRDAPLGLIHRVLGRIRRTYWTKRRTKSMTDNSFQAFGESLRGELIQPDDQRYDTARKLYNGMIDRRPRAIARCADVSDILTAIHFARAH
jgi:hypothetical protein